MAQEDLFAALNMFKQGVGELALGRAISGANEAVQQVKASEMNEQQQRAQLQTISNQLVGQLASIGTPATTIAQLTQAMGPKQYANSSQMYSDALLTGDKGLEKEASKLQDFEFNLENKKSLALMKYINADPSKKAAFEALQDERWMKHVEALDKRIDTQTARFGNIGKLQQVNNSILDARQLMHGDIYNLNVAEMAKTLDRILSQSAPTISGTAEVTPQTLKQMLARAKEFVTSEPQKVDIPAFVQFYSKTLDRIEKVNTGIINNAQRSVVKGLSGQVAPEFRGKFLGYINDKLGVEATYDAKGRLQFKDNVEAKPSPAAAVPAAPQPMINPDGTPMEMVTVRNNVTGLPETAFLGSDGNIYK